MTLFASTDEHTRTRNSDDPAGAHLAQQPRRDVVWVDVGNGPLGGWPADAAGRRRAASCLDGVRPIRGGNIYREIEDETMLADLEMRVVQQLHRSGAEDLTVDADGEARWEEPDGWSCGDAHEKVRGWWESRGY